MADTIVQYVIVRTDLINAMDWTVGAVIAQACHATTAAAQEYKDDECTQQYFSDVNNMHKIVLGIGSEQRLQNLSKRLKDFDVEHRVWVEQPENIATCLVTKPAPKGDVAEYFKKLQLFRLSNGKKKKNKRGDDEERREGEREDGKGGGGDEGEGNGDDSNKNDGEDVERGDDDDGEDRDFKHRLKESTRAEMEERKSNSPKLPPISKYGLN